MTKKKFTIAEIKAALAGCQDPNAALLCELRQDERKSVQQLVNSWEKKQLKRIERQQKFLTMQQFESATRQRGFHLIAGVDEVGRGPLAGPVVAAAVILPEDMQDIGLDDSKKLSSKKRKLIVEQLQTLALAIGVGIVEADIIDKVNIYQASKLAMQQAIANLSMQPDYLLIDAMQLDLPIQQEGIIKGDAKSLSIAAASIIAKELRDQLMERYHDEYPDFNFKQNAGYGTKEHLAALELHGPTPIHRKSFAPISQWDR